MLRNGHRTTALLLASGLFGLVGLVVYHRAHGSEKPTAPSAAVVVDVDPGIGWPTIDSTAPGEIWFDGTSLAEWQHLGGGRVLLENGLIVLRHDAERRPGYLVYRNAPGRDGMVRVRCRITDGDSGLFFRSRVHPRHASEIQGPQVQLNTTPGRGLGGVFFHHGPGWLRRPAHEPVVPPKQWLDVHLKLLGPRVGVTVNGVVTVDCVLRAPDNHLEPADGFALQIHGGGTLRAEFSHIDFVPWTAAAPISP